MAITSKVDVCNLSLGHLGNYGTVTNIDVPTNDKERVFKLWYDITRQATLKQMMPNFALARKVVAQMDETPAFGYAYAYEYPNDCLKMLGIDGVSMKENNYAVEAGRILTNEDYPDGMPIRYIEDVTDVTRFSPEFKILLSQELGAAVALGITQDVQKAAKITAMLPQLRMAASGMNAQENRPIRISNSRFRAARRFDVADRTEKP